MSAPLPLCVYLLLQCMDSRRICLTHGAKTHPVYNDHTEQFDFFYEFLSVLSRCSPPVFLLYLSFSISLYIYLSVSIHLACPHPLTQLNTILETLMHHVCRNILKIFTKHTRKDLIFVIKIRNRSCRILRQTATFSFPKGGYFRNQARQ